MLWNNGTEPTTNSLERIYLDRDVTLCPLGDDRTFFAFWVKFTLRNESHEIFASLPSLKLLPFERPSVLGNTAFLSAIEPFLTRLHSLS